MWKLALRNVMRQRVRSGMTIGAIAVGVISLILAGGFVADIFVQLRESTIHSQLGHIQIYKEGYFQYGSQAPSKYLMDDPERLKATIRKVPGIQDVMARLSFSALLSNGRADIAIVGEGVEPSKEAALGTYIRIVSGRALTDADRFGIVVGEGIAQSRKLSPGDNVTLLINTKDGSLNSLDFEVVGIFRSFSKDFDARAVRISAESAKELLGTPGINSLVVSLKNTDDTAPVAARLASEFKGEGLELFTWNQLSDFYRNAADLYAIQFGVLKLIILGMVLLGVVNSVNMSIFERYGEFGTMRAVGDRNTGVFMLVAAENTIVGAAGAAIGVVLGAILALIISAIGIPMPPPPNASSGFVAHVLLDPGNMAEAFGTGLLATIAAAIIPAFRVSRSEISEALRRNI